MMDDVSREQFVEYLAERLGITEEEASKKLTELILHIRDSSASGKVSIDGLGTFSNKNKSLTFAPDEAFEIEINHNYAGMMPVVIDTPKPKTETTGKKAEKDDAIGKEELPAGEPDEETPDFEEEEFVDVIGEPDPFDFDDEYADADTVDTTGKTGTVPAASDVDVDDDEDADPEAAEAEKVRNAALKDEKKRMEEAAKAAKEQEELEKAKAAEEAKEQGKLKEEAKTKAKSIADADSDAEADPDADAMAKDEAKDKDEFKAEDKVEDKAESSDIAAKRAKDKEISAPAPVPVPEYTPDLESEAETVSGAKPPPEPEKEQGKTGKDTISPAWTDTAGGTSETEQADQHMPAGKSNRLHDRTRVSGNTGTIAAILVAAVVVLAAALYFLGFLPGTQPEPGTVTTQQTVPAPERPDATGQADPTLSESEQLADEEAEQDVTARPIAPDPADEAVQADLPPASPPTDAAQATEYGLTGTINTNLQRPYTIIVHSLNSRSDAERESAQLLQAGYRSNYYAVNLPDGRTNWRVSIGQFSDIDSAVQATQQLPEPYQTNNFIGRIESYNP